MSYHTGGMSMRTTMGNRATTQRRTRTAPRSAGRVVTPRRGRMVGNGTMLNGTGARGIRRTTGQFGRGGVRRANVTRPSQILRRGRTTPTITNRQPARARATSGNGVHGFRGVDQFGNNI